MPHLDHEQIRALVGDQASADYELDLRGVSGEQARVAIERMLEGHGFVETTTVAIRIEEDL